MVPEIGHDNDNPYCSSLEGQTSWFSVMGNVGGHNLQFLVDTRSSQAIVPPCDNEKAGLGLSANSSTACYVRKDGSQTLAIEDLHMQGKNALTASSSVINLPEGADGILGLGPHSPLAASYKTVGVCMGGSMNHDAETPVGQIHFNPPPLFPGSKPLYNLLNQGG